MVLQVGRTDVVVTWLGVSQLMVMLLCDFVAYPAKTVYIGVEYTPRRNGVFACMLKYNCTLRSTHMHTAQQKQTKQRLT